MWAPLQGAPGGHLSSHGGALGGALAALFVVPAVASSTTPLFVALLAAPGELFDELLLRGAPRQGPLGRVPPHNGLLDALCLYGLHLLELLESSFFTASSRTHSPCVGLLAAVLLDQFLIVVSWRRAPLARAPLHDELVANSAHELPDELLSGP